MPLSTPRPCRKMGCREVTREGYCPEHKKEKTKESWSDKRAPRRLRNPIYSTARWRDLRRMMLRQQPTCQGADCTRLALEVDHITSMQNGGSPFDPSNLQCLCTSCHARKTAKEYHQEKKTRKAEPK